MAYIKINKITFDKYLLLLDNAGISLLKKNKHVRKSTKPLDETLEISINKLDPNSAAIQLLYLCSYMAAEGIDESLFNKHPDLLPSPLNEVVNDEIEMIDVWQELTQYSLLKKQINEKGEESYTMHRLLQEVVKNKISENQQWALCCLDIFRKTYTFEFGNVTSHNNFMKLTPHVEAFLNASKSYLREDEQQNRLGLLYNWGGYGLSDLGYYSHALEWFQNSLKIYEEVLDEEHLKTATAYNNIAYIYDMLGDYNNALEWYHKTLAIDEKILDADDLSIMVSYNNIAMVYNNLEDYNKALEFYHMSMIIREKELGLQHPDTALSYNNMGYLYSEQGNYNTALKWYHKSLTIKEKILGVEHPSTITTYNNIACTYENMGDNEKATEYFHKAKRMK